MAPSIVERPARPYVSITTRVPMSRMADEVPPLTGEVFGWLAAHGAQPDGPPFWKYNVIDMAGELEIEAGVAVAAPVEGDDRVSAGTLPAGRYAYVRFHGHPDGLEQATGDLLQWAEGQGLSFDTTEVDGEERWAARLEEYLDDPAEKPDMSEWDTDLAFKLTD